MWEIEWILSRHTSSSSNARIQRYRKTHQMNVAVQIIISEIRAKPSRTTEVPSAGAVSECDPLANSQGPTESSLQWASVGASLSLWLRLILTRYIAPQI